MCGIIAGFNTTTKKKKPIDKVNKFIIDQYQRQYSRGTQGFGIIRINPKGQLEIDRACEPTKFLIDLYLKDAPMIIAHHRTPTSTNNELGQTHPIIISNDLLKYNYCFIHNGIITNDDELNKKHKELGFTYSTEYTEYTQYYKEGRIKFNDSEALAIEVALFIEEKITAIELDNSAAFIILQIEKETGSAKKVFFGRNGISSCLNMNKEKNKIRISSEGEGKEIKENILYSFKIEDPSMTLEEKDIPFKRKEIPKEEQKSIFHHNHPLTSPKENTPAKKEEKPEETNIRKLRPWTDLDKDTDYFEDPIIEPGKEYISEISEEFKKKLKEDLDENSTPSDITHIIDDALDEEIEKISEIITSYKNILSTDHLEPIEQSYFMSRISTIMKGMRILTDIAETTYNQKEEEQEIADYNVGFEPTKPNNTGYLPKKDTNKYGFRGNDEYQTNPRPRQHYLEG